MRADHVDVVVVGAGQAGLGAAYHLATAGVECLVLERGRIGETWLSQRWDSFCLNTPNWMNGLPGEDYSGEDPFGFMTHQELVTSFNAYVERFDLRVRTGVNVTSIRGTDSGSFQIAAEEADGDSLLLTSGAVVLASGILQSPHVPSIASKFPERIAQLHAGSYRAPDLLDEGAVVVIGGGQSGAQIVEDLLAAGRTVYFSVSSAPRLPRRYRGRDFMDWMVDLGIWDATTDDVEDPAVLRATNPLTSGVGPLGHTVSLQQLAGDGARLMGRLEDVEGSRLLTDERVNEYARNADESSAELEARIDAFVAESNMTVGEPEEDPADVPLPPDGDLEYVTSLDLDDAEVSTVIWSTGFTGDFSWVHPSVTDSAGRPVHHNGVAEVPGVYFIGFPWLSKRKSGVVYGIDEDARHITQVILERRGKTT